MKSRRNLYREIIKNKRCLFKRLCLLSLLLLSQVVLGQQTPGYTEYMYNTMSVNPGYAGSQGHLMMNVLVRSQWRGIDGAPQTQTFSIDSPVGYAGLGLGLNIINDKLGPSTQRYIDGNISYTLMVGEQGNLSFGLKLGGRFLNVDWSKGIHKQNDNLFNENISKFFPALGAGLYYYTNKFYMGLSVPDFLLRSRYDHNSATVTSSALEQIHYFLIGGYVFDWGYAMKFKPAFLLRAVSGAPISLDISANFLFYNRFTLGASYRWRDSVSALFGFRVTNNLRIGYAYDVTTTNLRNYNSGTHEVMLRYEFINDGRLKSPRFF